jgi:hypothetical protein
MTDRSISIRAVCPADTPAWDMPGAECRFYPWGERGICAMIPEAGDVLLVVSGEQGVMAITAGDALARMYRDLGETLWRSSANPSVCSTRMDRAADGFKSK